MHEKKHLLTRHRHVLARVRELTPQFVCGDVPMTLHFSDEDIRPIRVSLEEVLQWSQSFEKLITSRYGPMIYKTYLETEHSDENIKFWLACEAYKKITSQRKRILVARKLFTNYIQAQAPNEINIDSPVRKTITRNLQEPTESCFDEAQRIIYMHMERDSYPRFLESKFYQKLKHSLQTNSNNPTIS